MALLFLPTGLNGLTVGLFLYALIIICGCVIDSMGGTHNSYLHCFYLPIIFAGMSLGVIGGTMAGLLSAFIVGPYMPSYHDPLIEQTVNSWLFRGFIFVAVGFIAGGGATLYERFNVQQQQRLLTDPVTNLLNLRGLKLRCDDIINQSLKRPIVLIMEIQHLNDIEQALGSEAMHEFLYKIAIHLQHLADHTLTLAHLYSGGFVIMVNDLTKALRLIDLCQEHIPKSFIINNVPLLVESYFGIAEWTKVDNDFTSVMRKARIAVVKAERTRHVKMIYEQTDDKRLERSIHIIHDFAHALENQELTLHYQPKLDLQTDRVYGVEALVRWQHKQFGMISPQDFIPIIERTLLINPFTTWVIKQSLQQLALWRANNVNLSLAINFSIMNFEDTNLLELLITEVSRHQIPPHLIEIEITETAIAYNMQNIVDALTLLRNKGFRLAIDDFGTGQSSLKYLCELPVDTLKIDKFFVQSATTNPASASIIRTAVLLAKELNLTTVAEGIETPDILQWLKTIGCRGGQGFFITKPLPADEVLQWIETRNYTM